MEEDINVVRLDLEDDNLGLGLDSGEGSETVEACNNKKRPKLLTSQCWKFFTKIGSKNDGNEKAKCNRCGQEYKIGGTYGTSHLHRHIGKCKQIKFHDVSQMMLDVKGGLTARKIDQMVARKKCAYAIIAHDLPFSFVEYKYVREWLKYLNPNATLITRNTAKADILNLYLREKDSLKKELSSIRTRISLTSGLWTACTTEGYITLTAHYVDYNWKLNSKILNFCHMPPPHTGFELSNKILQFLNEWRIEKKFFSITLDNASANYVMQDVLKSQLTLQNWLLCDGQFFHVRCCAHILNLIFQEGLKIASDALHKIRESIKHVRSSESRMQKFKLCIEKVGGVETSAGLCLDVPTRWNSNYLMLESAIKYRRVSANLRVYDENYKWGPSVEEWQRA